MPTPIDRKFVDIDLSIVPDDHIDSDQNGPGLIEETDDEVLAASSLMSSFETEYPHLMLTKSERKELAKKNWESQQKSVSQIYSQGRTSACVGFGSAQALELTYNRRYGKEDHVSLSGMFVYRYIGRTLMSGAMISDGMKRVSKVGTLPLSNPENDSRFDLTWNILDYRKKPPSNYKEKIQHRVTKFGTARGGDEIESALANNFCGIVGRSRHCVPYFGLMYEGNDSFVPYANSWSSSWGDNGIGYDSFRTYRNLTLYVILEVAVPTFIQIPVPT